MKKKSLIILCVFLITVFAGCISWNRGKESDENMVEKISDFVEIMGKNQITKDKSLIGERILEDRLDYYCGAYRTEAEQITKREVVFGGATIEERKIKCSGVVYVISGKADIRVRMNEEVIYLEPDENGCFMMDFSFKSGGNYIMIDYENFTGSIELRCTEEDEVIEE